MIDHLQIILANYVPILKMKDQGRVDFWYNFSGDTVTT